MSTESAIVRLRRRSEAEQAAEMNRKLHQLNGRKVRVSGMSCMVFVEGPLGLSYDAAHTCVWTVAQDMVSVTFTAEAVARVDFERVFLRRACA